MPTLNSSILARMVSHLRRRSPLSRWMTEAANASKRLSKKCTRQTSRTSCRNKHKLTSHSKSCVKASASFQECSTQCDKQDRKAETVEFALP